MQGNEHQQLKSIESKLLAILTDYVDENISLSISLHLGEEQSFPWVGAIKNGDGGVHLEALLDRKMLVSTIFPNNDDDKTFDEMLGKAIDRLEESVVEMDGHYKLMLVEPCLIEISKLLGKSAAKTRRIDSAGEHIPKSAKAIRASNIVHGQTVSQIVQKSISDVVDECIIKKFKSAKFSAIVKPLIDSLKNASSVADFETIQIRCPEVIGVVGFVVSGIKPYYRRLVEHANDLTSYVLLNEDEQIVIRGYLHQISDSTDTVMNTLNQSISNSGLVSIHDLVAGEIEINQDVAKATCSAVEDWTTQLSGLCDRLRVELEQRANPNQLSLSMLNSFLNYFKRMISSVASSNRIDGIKQEMINTVYGAVNDSVRAAIRIKLNAEEGDFDLVKWSRPRRFKTFKRTGGRDVSALKDSPDFLPKYQMRALVFGEYVSDAKRADYLQRASSALSDMADIMGEGDEAMGELTRGSSGAKLGFSIGARGQGKSAMATYESGKSHVLNITRDAIQGTVGHEFFHSIDFAGSSRSVIKAALAGDDTLPVDIIESVKELMKAVYFSPATEYIETVSAEIEETKVLSEKYSQRFRDETTRINEKYRGRYLTLRERGSGYRSMTDEEKRAYDIDAKLLDKSIAHERASANFYQMADKACREKIKKLRAVTYTHGDLGEQPSQAAVQKYIDAIGRIDSIFQTEVEGFMKEQIAAGYDCGPSKFMQKSTRLDSLKKKGRGASYWATPHELAARAFESYLADRMTSQGRENNYLVDNQVIDSGGAYLTNEKERGRVVEAIEYFLSVLKKHRKDI